MERGGSGGGSALRGVMSRRMMLQCSAVRSEGEGEGEGEEVEGEGEVSMILSTAGSGSGSGSGSGDLPFLALPCAIP